MTASSLHAPRLIGTLSTTKGVIDFARLDSAARDADIAEVRLDQIPEHDWSAVLSACDQLEANGTPVLCTIRLKAEGGAYPDDDRARLDAYRRVLDHCTWVDVEAASVIAADLCSLAHDKNRRVILSAHDFVSTPTITQLAALYDRSRALGADVVKLAAMTTTREHHGTLIQWVMEHADDGTVCALGMGPFGLPLRVYLPAIGSVFTYAYLDHSAAPGQIHCAQMRQILRTLLPSG